MITAELDIILDRAQYVHRPPQQRAYVQENVAMSASKRRHQSLQ